jgi:uncharacterized membrane protein
MVKSRANSLVVALSAANVFLIGALAGGGAVCIHNGKFAPTKDLPLGGDALPAAQKAALRNMLVAIRQESLQTIFDEYRARMEAAALLEQPILDKASLAETLKRAREDDLQLQARIDQRSVDFASALPPKDRILLAHAIERNEEPVMNAPSDKK